MKQHSEEHFEQYQFSIGKINVYLDGHYQKMFSLVTKLEEMVDTNLM